MRPAHVLHGGRGFTLLELLVALAIVAVLAGLASAGWGRTLASARRVDARASLLALASAQERHRLQHARYAARLGAGTPEELRFPDASPQGWYAVGLVEAGAGTWRAEARPRGSQRRDRDCALFVLEDTGRREARDADGADATARCWG